MPGRTERMAPLIEQLQRFCLGHEQGDRGAAAEEMLARLRQGWAEIADVSLEPDQDDRRDAEEVALSIVRDIGEVANLLLAAGELHPDLAWSRANLISDLERYALVVKPQT